MSPDVPPEVRRVGLRYWSDDMAAIRRLRSGRVFRYEDADGGAINQSRTLERIRSLAVPPAWTDVRICPNDEGYLQATGRDARDRKQYRYHAE
jgi:DNA topoisomerase-1